MLNLFLMGPTAVGKSDTAIEIAKRFPCRLISVDSAMIYRGMDIGTAKPSLALLSEYPHALIDVCDPHDHFSVGMFCRQAEKEIIQAQQDNKIALLVGGSMMYFHALEFGLSLLPESSKEIREKVSEKAIQDGWDTLHKELKTVDPDLASRIQPSDKQRIARALEVFYTTGIPLSYYQKNNKKEVSFSFHKLAILPKDRKILHNKIKKRFEQILEKGFLSEVEKLFSRGDLSLNLPSMRSVGYRQAWEYLEGKCDFVTMQEKAIIATRQLAKRQLTWLKNWPNLQTYYLEEIFLDELFYTIENLIKNNCILNSK